MHDPPRGSSRKTGLRYNKALSRCRTNSATGMDNQTNRLVDDDQRVVFKNHLKWNVLRLFGKHRIGRFGTERRQTRPQTFVLESGDATPEDSSRLEPGLQAAAGMFGETSEQAPDRPAGRRSRQE